MSKENEESKDINTMEELLHKKEIELQNHYCSMGKKLLEIADAEQKSINNLVDDIIKIRRQLIKTLHQIECPYCVCYNDSDSNYCKHCGKSLTYPNNEKEN